MKCKFQDEGTPNRPRKIVVVPEGGVNLNEAIDGFLNSWGVELHADAVSALLGGRTIHGLSPQMKLISTIGSGLQ